jgi:hypothetical protein
MLPPLRVYAFGVMSLDSEPRTTRPRETTRRTPRVLFVVSRDRPDRYDSLVHAFGSDADVKVIFDRRRTDRRQHDRSPMVDRRQSDRRSDVRQGAVRSVGWVRVENLEVSRRFHDSKPPRKAQGAREHRYGS